MYIRAPLYLRFIRFVVRLNELQTLKNGRSAKGSKRPILIPSTFYQPNAGAVHVWSGELNVDGKTEFVNNSAGRKGGEECFKSVASATIIDRSQSGVSYDSLCFTVSALQLSVESRHGRTLSAVCQYRVAPPSSL